VQKILCHSRHGPPNICEKASRLFNRDCVVGIVNRRAAGCDEGVEGYVLVGGILIGSSSVKI
jgi:hypothetical protein